MSAPRSPSGRIARALRPPALAALVVAAAAAAAPARAQCTQPTPVTTATCEAAKAYNRQTGGVSLLVWVGGQRVCEDYVLPSGASVPHELWSCTKSFSSMTAAKAMEEGLISSWDERLADTLPEWQSDPRKSRITLRQLLGLVSGIQASGEPTYAEAIQYPALHEPGTVFEYGSVPYQIFGEVLRRKLNGLYLDPLAYMEARIFEPIGAAYAGWDRGADGMPRLAWGSQWTPREWIKFGELVRLGGVWPPTQQQVLTQELIDASFHGSVPNPSYGLTWWLPGAAGPAGAPPCDTVAGYGLGTQKLYVVRSLGLVAVRQTDSPVAGLNYDDATFLDRLIAPPNWQDDCSPGEAAGFVLARTGLAGADLALDWAPVDDDALGRPELVAGYDVYAASSPTFAGETLVLSTAGPASAALAPGQGGLPASGAITYYRVRARDKCGNAGP